MCDSEATDYVEFETHNTIHDNPCAWKKIDHGLSYEIWGNNTLVLKRGQQDLDGFFPLFALLASFAITTFLLLAVFDRSIDYEHRWLYQKAVFFTGLFDIVFLFILGYTVGTSSFTGVTKMFNRCLEVFSLGALVYSIGWLLYASSDLLLHYVSYLLLVFSVLCFVNSVKCLSKHKSEVGNWTAIGDTILQNDIFLPNGDWLQGDPSNTNDPFYENRFLVIRTGNEVKLYERRDIVTEPQYTQILRKYKRRIEGRNKKLDERKSNFEPYSYQMENPYSNATMFEPFTDRAIKVEVIANREARRLKHEYIGTEHLLLALVQKAGTVCRKIFNDFNITETNVRQETEKLVKSGTDIPIVDEGKLPQTPRAKNVIKYAIEEAQNLQRNYYVGTEHILLGLLRETDGVAYNVLTNLGLQLNEVRKKVLELLSGSPE